MSLKSILEKIQEELNKREDVREEVQKDMRRATRLSKQAILFTHQERFKDAKDLLEEASKLFAKLREVSKGHPDLFYSGLVKTAFEEYAEAHTLLMIIEEDRFIDPEELGIPVGSYVLSLGDVVGELRRRALDSIRKGNVEAAEKCLETMEYIYSELTAMDDAYLLVSGLRRKCDVARHIIEITRGDVTIEARRSALENSILRLEEMVGKKRKVRRTKA
ncbi:MAG: translin family protein [Candidatus Bathyarchaeia archaeon]